MIDREVSIVIMIILIVTFDKSYQCRMRKKLSENLQIHLVLRIHNVPVYSNHNEGDCEM